MKRKSYHNLQLHLTPEVWRPLVSGELGVITLMEIKSKQQFSDLPTHDLTLKRIVWPEDNDNNLTILSEAHDGKIIEFYFEWVMNLKINLDLGDYAQAMTWDIVADIDSNRIWHIEWNYPGIGSIYLECNEIDYREL